MQRVAGLIVAAGRGVRAGGLIPKQYKSLLGRSPLEWSISALASTADEIIVAISPDDEALAKQAAADWPSVRLVTGGATRSESVRAALAATSADIVLVHDAARPGLSREVIERLVARVRNGAAAVAPALPVADSLRRSDGVEASREGVMRVQTPQAFDAAMLRAAYAAVGERSFTDDLSVAQAYGVAIELIEGDERLMKITQPGDFALIERLLADQRFVCVGTGFDAHRFGPGDHIALCGVRIPHEKGLVGHSDADAGWHALVDAILGALGEGDIGAHFPPSDPQWKGAASEKFLRHAATLIERARARLMHVDVTLICERPKISPHREAMRLSTAQVLGLPIERVSIKATTTERMGFTGREEGLAAQATATIERWSAL